MKRAALLVVGLVACATITDAPRPHDELVVTHTATKIEARVRLDGALTADAKVFVRTHAGGVEDFVRFEKAPARESLTYTMTPSPGAGLRFVQRTIELLDEHGTPRVRMEPPYVIDARGKRHDASVELEGCAFDASVAPPWDRPTTKPNATECRITIAWHDVEYPALVDPSWTLTDSFSPRHGHTAVKLSTGRVLFVYGEDCSGSCLGTSAADVYDPATKTFSPTGGIGGKVSDVPAVTLGNGKTLVMGPVAVGGKLYTPGTGLFSDAGPSTIERSVGSTVTLLANGKVLAAGGDQSATAEIYDPTANTFTLTPPMKASRGYHAATLLPNGKVLLSGGNTSSAELYDPVANTFTLTGSMSVARTGHAGILLPTGKVLVVGGGPKVAELYDPATGTFTTTGSLSDARTNVESVLMKSGNVYVTGGFANHDASPIVERYETKSGQFSLAPLLKVPRGRHRVTALDSARVLVTGGLNNDQNGTSLGAAEELDVTAAGSACAIDDDCASGICDLGVCCASACAGICQSCVAGTGECTTIKSADDPSSCTGTNTCDANGACKKKQGQACKDKSECATGNCVDDVCCNSACDRVCEACDGAILGTCTTIAGKPHPTKGRPTEKCPSADEICGGSCNGTDADACKFAGTDTGCGTSCADGVFTARACDGEKKTGLCTPQAPRPCAGNFACLNGETCRDSCTTRSDCALGYDCSNGKCTPAAYCRKDELVGVDRTTTTPCAPFSCDEAASRCRTACDEVKHCAEGFFCDFDNQCVARPKKPSGCAMSPRATSDTDLLPLGLVLATLFARRRAR